MITVRVVATVTRRGTATEPPVELARRDAVVSVMQIGRDVRAWVTRNFNHHLVAVGRNVIVDAEYHGQLARAPYHTYQGGLTGLNGVVTRRWGEYDQ